MQRNHFIKETGEGVNKRRRKPQFGLLHKAKDFFLDVDLPRQLKYPEHIAVIGSRPDIVIYVNSLLLAVHVELTYPCEENFQARHKKKGDRYRIGSDLKARCNANGWTAICLPVEVGARGYSATSLNGNGNFLQGLRT